MADKTLCPACQSYTSGINQAFNNDEPCPVCGLAAATAAEIDAIQTRRAELAPLLDQVRNEEWRPMGWNWR